MLPDLRLAFFSFKMLYEVKPYYTEYLPGIASLFRVVVGIGILLELVHYREKHEFFYVDNIEKLNTLF